MGGARASGANAPVPGSLHDFSSVRVASAGLGAADALGLLSVPRNWLRDPAVEPTSVDGVDTGPSFAVPSARGFERGLMSMMTGHRPDALATDREERGEDA
ncbi:PPE family protein, SVP subgroup [Mycobacterium scrofulaceum]|uniref:PPE family protein, SVP subgroup n=1 Tax=Mycobacterium scrofulaceum TaxID=1783 RepID=UPI00114F410D|nr:hypothetical protein [Mycobacterium scrofulaceum]